MRCYNCIEHKIEDGLEGVVPELLHLVCSPISPILSASMSHFVYNFSSRGVD